MSDSDLSYTFTCPSCAGNFSIRLERVPPVQARFRCPHCKQPMDFPSREEARVYARLQSQEGAGPARPAAPSAPEPPAAGPPGPSGYRPHAAAGSPAPSPARSTSTMTMEENGSHSSDNVRFRVDKPGFETDVFDRRAMRNLIRSGEVDERDPIRVDEAAARPAVEIDFLRSLFSLRKTSRVTPPVCCRTHTDRVAHFKCRENGRPLCEDCASEKKFGGTTIRVCAACGGTATELVSPLA